MYKKEEGMIHRMTTTAIGTYSALAVSGDLCVIEGLSCGREHAKQVSWSAKICSPVSANDSGELLAADEI